MSFGDKKLDRAYDNWVTQTPEEYFRTEEGETSSNGGKIELGKVGVSWMSGTYSKRQGILLKVIEIKGHFIVKDKDGVPRLVEAGENVKNTDLK